MAVNESFGYTDFYTVWYLHHRFVFGFSPLLLGVAAAVLTIIQLGPLVMCRSLWVGCWLLPPASNGRLQTSIGHTASEAAGGGR